MTADKPQNILIVGAGPVGLFLGFRLAKEGIKVDIIEKEDSILQQPRASACYGPASFVLKEAGLLQLVSERGYVGTSFGWRPQVKDDGNGGKTWGDLLAELPFRAATAEHPERGMSFLPQHKFAALIMEQALETGNLTVHFGTELIAINNDQPDRATATVRDVKSGVEREMVSAFLVGTDGGKSTTRKLLGIPMQGHTWPERIVATDVIVPPLPIFLEAPAHFFMHPLHFGVVVPLEKPVAGQPGLWRFTLAVDPADTRTDEEILEDESLRNLFEVAMPGPRPLQYELRRRAIYRIHQRLATTMFRGRCMLAGDSAHLNNPFGAMGLTTGILDVDSLTASLLMIYSNEQPVSVLAKWSDERRKVFQNFVDPTTSHNKLRIQRDPATAYEDWAIKLLKNPSDETMAKFLIPYGTVWPTDMKAVVQESS
ncbi:hypothetical protein F66182_9079 [Fusarium sp. NRRL 66182]|nr:hypothetical protein F66182_9079 [Fusarium sp. NRRL 66182]